MIRKVVVGISGGIDSAVSCMLLKQKGFNVQAVFMKNWDMFDETGMCTGEKDLADAQWICDKLKVPFMQVNFVKQYWNDVFEAFLADYQNGWTPNPDIKCNAFIKFDAFHKYAREYLLADAVATGHYARSSFGNYLEHFQDGKNVKLLCAEDTFKDQTFFLSQVPQSGLRRAMFPLGDFLKCNVKQMAANAGLTRILKKRESVGICFIGKRNLHEFMSEYVKPKPGNFVDFDTGKILGQHDGIHYWTVGQRAPVVTSNQKMFVLRKLSDERTILLCGGTHHPGLYSKLLYTQKPHWIDKNPLELSMTFTCQFRFQHVDELLGCVICITATEGLIVRLDLPLRALTAGQYAVFYKDGECLGSARIISPGPSLLYATEEEKLLIGDSYKYHSQIKKQTKGYLNDSRRCDKL